MGIPTLSQPVGETPARPVHSHETHSVTKKSRKSSKESPSAHSGPRSETGLPEQTSRSFSSIYKKSLGRAQKPSGDGAEEALLSPEGKRKEGAAPHGASPSSRGERSRKKKVRSGGENVALLPLVNPGEGAEKPVRPAPSVTDKGASVLWGPQKGGAILAEAAGKSGPAKKPLPASMVPGISVASVAPAEQAGIESGQASGKIPLASPDKGFAGTLGAGALASSLKNSIKKGSDVEPLRGEQTGEGGGIRSAATGKDVSLRNAMEIKGLSPEPAPAASGAEAPSPLQAVLASDSSGKSQLGGEAGSRNPSSHGGEMAAALEASGATASGADAAGGGSGSPSAVAAAIPGRVANLAAGGGGQVALEVKPPHLGPVGVRVQVDASTRQVRVELSSHDPRIRHLLAGKEGEIKESLSQSGFVLDRFVVGSQGQPAAGPADIASGFAPLGAGSGSGQDSGTGRQDSQGSGTGTGSGGSLTSDQGGFSRQGAHQPGLSGQFGREGGGRFTPEGGESPSVPAEDALSLAAPSVSGSSALAGYHRIA